MESSISLQMRKQDDSTRQINQLQNDQEHGKDYSWQRLQGQFQDNLDDVSKRLNHKEIAIKEEIEEKFQQLERVGYFQIFFIYLLSIIYKKCCTFLVFLIHFLLKDKNLSVVSNSHKQKQNFEQSLVQMEKNVYGRHNW